MSELVPAFRQQFFDANGKPLAGGQVFTYAAGTTTPLATYTDQTGNTPNTNPVILDSSGTANIWMNNASYKFVLEDSLGNVIETVDNVLSTASKIAAAVNVAGALSILNNLSDVNNAQTSLNNLVGSQTSGRYLRSNGTNVSLTAIQAGDVPTLNQNTSGSAASFTGALVGDVSGTQGANSVNKINGVTLSGLATGILKNTTSTGVPSIAVSGDFPTLNQNTSGSAASISASNVITNSNLTQMATNTIKGNNTGGTANAADLTVAQVNTMLGSLSNPMTTAGDIIYGGTAGAATRLATATGVLVGGSPPTYSTTPTLTGTNITGIPLAGLAAAAFNTTPTASTLAEWNASKNLSANAFIEGFTSIATAATTTTLVVGSTYAQTFTGVTTQIVALPVASTLVTGQSFLITNLSSGIVTVQTSGANAIQAMVANTQLALTCINSAGGTGTASWSWVYSPCQNASTPVVMGGTGLATLTANGILLGAGTSAPTFLAPGASGNVPTSNGTIWQSTAAGTSPTANYAQAFFSSTTAQWTTTSATYVDFTLAAGANTLTVRKSSGITLTAAASNLPGITFTLANNTAVYLITATVGFATSLTSNYLSLQLTDGTSVISQSPGVNGGNVAADAEAVSLSGIYAPATTGSITVKLQGAISSGTGFIQAVGGLNGAVEWTVMRIF